MSALISPNFTFNITGSIPQEKQARGEPIEADLGYGYWKTPSKGPGPKVKGPTLTLIGSVKKSVCITVYVWLLFGTTWELKHMGCPAIGFLVGFW